MGKLNLVLVIHNHQPVGNFDSVFEEACDKAYGLFLATMERFPSIRFAIHYSGCLLEWMEWHRPEFLQRISKLTSEGRAEILGGGFYEPILTMLPERDRQGQLRTFSDYLERRFGTRPSGMWLAERVWEQNLVRSIADAGISYSIVDDFHFRCAGLSEGDLKGYYTTEDEGRLLRLFAGSERLRYMIPFAPVGAIIGYLKDASSKSDNLLLTYADDGEKFGVWPETHRHCYVNKWLEQFLSALEANKDWLVTTLPRDALASFRPEGRVYLPDASYREMTEWALPVPAALDLRKAWAQVPSALRKSLRPFVRGGIWRNFKRKYLEAHQMYARMLEVSRDVGLMPDLPQTREATTQLYRAQCNCAYWHGVFGGLYLPYLRDEVYRRLIAADVALHDAVGGPPVTSNQEDLDFDGCDEVSLRNSHLKAYLKPSRGGHLYELDILDRRVNILAGLTRREEAYHHPAKTADPSGTEAVSIHALEGAAAPDLEKMLRYDWYPREALIDHFFGPSASLESVSRCDYEEQGDFVLEPYQAATIAEGTSRTVRLTRTGSVWCAGKRRSVELVKSVTLSPDESSILTAYSLIPKDGGPCEAHFGVEFNFAMLTGDAEDRFYYEKARTRLGVAGIQAHRPRAPMVGLADGWRRLDIELCVEPDAFWWMFPIKTVSQSERGKQLVYQCSAVIPSWKVSLSPSRPWQSAIRLEIRYT